MPKLPSHLERPLRNRIEKVWKEDGLFYWPVNDLLIAGLPDTTGILPGGRAFHVEFKADDGVLAPIQLQWLQKIAMMQGLAIECRADLTAPHPYYAKYRVMRQNLEWTPWINITSRTWLQNSVPLITQP